MTTPTREESALLQRPMPPRRVVVLLQFAPLK
jgi:hypothetical protein